MRTLHKKGYEAVVPKAVAVGTAEAVAEHAAGEKPVTDAIPDAG